MSETNSTYPIFLHENACTGSDDDIKLMQLKLQEHPTLIHSLNYFNTPLHNAVQVSHKLCVQFLLSAGADIEARNNLGNTSLHLAIFSKDLDLAKILLEHGVNVNFEPHDHVQAKQNYLCIACRLTWYEMAELLLQYGATTEDNLLCYQNYYPPQSLMTPIAIATCEGDVRIVKLLLLYGAKSDTMHVNSKNKTFTLPFLLLKSFEEYTLCKIEILNTFQLFGINISQLETYDKIRNSKLYPRYKILLSQPLSLENLSRICIYRAIGKNYINKLQNLETSLPSQIMDILKFSEI